MAGLLVVIGYLSVNYWFVDTGEQLAITIHQAALVLAGVMVAYALLGFRFVARKSQLLGGFISFFLFTSMAAVLVLDTGGFESQFLALWMIVAILAGMFGWKVLILLWAATNAYYFLLTTGTIEADTDLQKTVLYLIAAQLPFLMGYFVWVERISDPSSRKKVKGAGGFTKESLGSDTLIKSIAEGVLVVDSKNIIQVFNTSAEDITGWKEDEAIGLDYRSVFTMTDQKDQQILSDDDPFLKVFASGSSLVENNLILHTRNDKRLEMSLVTSPVKAADGVVGAVVGVFRDVSEERNAERQRGEFISTASHEMRTPVAAIEGYLALALNDQVSKIDSHAREYLEKAHASTQHLGQLFQDLLTAAKSEDGRLKNVPRVIDIGALTAEIAESAKFTAEKKNLILETNFGGSSQQKVGEAVVTPIYYVLADPDRLREVLTNLTDNAIKYTSEGKISIILQSDKEKVVVGVRDTGPGIAQEDIPHLFQKFYRVDSSATRSVGGTGLGLFISRKIIELNNGRIWVESEPGQGSTFYISLPRLDNMKAQELLKKEEQAKSPLSDVTESAKL
ncbi:MAG: ATP-binding protein [Candidatus Saccharimonadales bacterium]|nr:ATP-binding protein [Candidatus Saccharimonadales bacterium]